jgi:hypothetical protein
LITLRSPGIAQSSRQHRTSGSGKEPKMIRNINHMLVEPYQRELQKEAAQARLAATAKRVAASKTGEHKSPAGVPGGARRFAAILTGLLAAASHPANLRHHRHHASTR